MNGITTIQIILIAGIIGIFVYYISRFRSAFIDLLIMILFAGLGIFFIIFPEKTNDIAKKVGVGRGADLLFYCCILFFLFILIKLFSRIRRLEKNLTDLVRKQAMDEAKQPGNTDRS